MSSNSVSRGDSSPYLSHNSHTGVFKYNGPCLAFFAVTGILLQIPVLIAHCGIVGRPNIPVVILSTIYAYLCLSFAVTAISWTSDDMGHWWSGAGWCDLDVRVFLAASLAVLSTQVVINWNMLDILRENVKISSRAQTLLRTVCEITACLFLPIVNLAVSTFTMKNRFGVVQFIGCLANVDFSAAYIVTFLIWLPILGLGAIVTIFLIVFRFWRRGKSASIESVSFIPYMSVGQFVRIIIFSLVVSVVLGPLSISLSVVNFINVGNVGVHSLAWLHGKPEEWDIPSYMLIDQVPMPANGWGPRPTFILDTITRYINLAIAWLLFLCYGTGTVAQHSYAHLLRKFLHKDIPSTANVAELKSLHSDEERVSPTKTLFGGSISSAKFNEWDASAMSSNKVLHVWEGALMPEENVADFEVSQSDFSETVSTHSGMPRIVPVRGAINEFLGGFRKPFANSGTN